VRRIRLQDLGSVAILLVVSGVVLSIGSQIVGEIKTSDSMTTISTTNESVNFAANDTYYTLSNQPLKSVDAIYNDTGHTYTYPTSYYTARTGNDGAVKIYTNGTAEGDYNITTGTHYVDYTSYDVAYNISENTQEGLDDLGGWMPTIALVVAATIVIGIIIHQFGSKRTVAGL